MYTYMSAAMEGDGKRGCENEMKWLRMKDANEMLIQNVAGCLVWTHLQSMLHRVLIVMSRMIRTRLGQP